MIICEIITCFCWLLILLFSVAHRLLPGHVPVMCLQFRLWLLQCLLHQLQKTGFSLLFSVRQTLLRLRHHHLKFLLLRQRLSQHLGHLLSPPQHQQHHHHCPVSYLLKLQILLQWQLHVIPWSPDCVTILLNQLHILMGLFAMIPTAGLSLPLHPHTEWPLLINIGLLL